MGGGRRAVSRARAAIAASRPEQLFPDRGDEASLQRPDQYSGPEDTASAMAARSGGFCAAPAPIMSLWGGAANRGLSRFDLLNLSHRHFNALMVVDRRDENSGRRDQ